MTALASPMNGSAVAAPPTVVMAPDEASSAPGDDCGAETPAVEATSAPDDDGSSPAPVASDEVEASSTGGAGDEPEPEAAVLASGDLLTCDRAREAVGHWQNWTLNQECTSLSRRFDAESFVSATAFIQAVTEMSEEHDHYADIQMSKGKQVCVKLSTTVDGVVGVSEKDFLLADCFDQIPVGSASAGGSSMFI